jgi:hypothetical protein
MIGYNFLNIITSFVSIINNFVISILNVISNYIDYHIVLSIRYYPQMARIDNAVTLVCGLLYEHDRSIRLCTVKVKSKNEKKTNIEAVTTIRYIKFSLSPSYP